MNLFNFIINLQLIVLTAFRQTNCGQNIGNFGSDQQLSDIRQDFDELAKDFLESLKVAHKLVDPISETPQTEEELVRNKRSPQIYQRKADSYFHKGVFRLRGIVPLHSTCIRPLDFTTVGFNGIIYGICVSQPTAQTPAKVGVGPITPLGWERDVISWPVRDPKNVVSFVDEDKDSEDRNLYVLVADSASRDGTDVVVINKHNQKINKEQHTVNSRYPTAIALWKSRADNTYHLAIANSYGTAQTPTFKSETFTYSWMQTYFDRYSEMTTFYVKDICPFNIHSNEFLAVANFKAGPTANIVDSEIFKLDIDRKKWRSFQRIRTFGAVDWEYFTFGSDHSEEYFLAVANNFDINGGLIRYDVNSVIYKFSEDKFVPFQSLPTLGATQIKTFRGPDGEFVLAVANMHQAVHIYQYNGWHFVETSVQYTSGVMSPGVVSLHFDYLPTERSGVLFVSNPHHPSGHMFRMEFVHENPLGEWHNKSLHWCESTDREVNRFGTHSLRPLFKDVFYVDQNEPIVINGDLNMTDLIVDNIQTPILVDLSSGDELSHRLIDELVKLDVEMRAAEVKLGQIVDILSNALRTTGDQVVTAPQTFNTVAFECRPEMVCNVGQLHTGVLNNDNIVGLAEDILPLNMDQTIDHSMHFQNLRVDNNLILDGVINGLNTTHIVTKQGSHDILATKTLLNDVTANEVVCNDLINDKTINPSTVLLTVGDQVINNSIKFSDNILLPNLQVNGPVNGIHINQLLANIVTKDTDHIIKGEKRFNDIEMNDLLMKAESTINGIDIIKLWNDVLWTYGDQEVTAPINFTNIAIGGNLYVNGLINGIRVPEDVILTNQNAVITSKKQFVQPVRVDLMEVLHSINGIGLVNRNTLELDVMSRYMEQTVVGHKIFNEVHLGGHSLVRGTVDGVKLSELRRTLLLRNTSQHFDVLEIRGNAFFDAGLDLKTTINGLRLEELYNNALKLTDRHIPPFPHFQMNVAAIKSLECHSINGLNIGTDLMTKSTPQVITGQKNFLNGINVDNNLNANYVNGIAMNFFNDTLLHEGQQVITGHKTFLSDLWVKSLKCNAINNISMNDLVLINGDQTIPSPKVFNDVHIYSDLNVNSFESNVINGVNMKELFENSLQFEKPQIITGRLNVESILLPKATNFETNTVNGIDLKKLMSDAVLTDIPQKITGMKTFLAPISIERTNFVRTFDNVTDFDLKYNWLLQDIPQTIRSDIVFDQKFKVENNIVMKVPIINNINLDILNNSTVKVDEPALIAGNTRFVAPLVSEGHIELSGRLQGLDLDKEAVTLDGNHRIFGRIHFANGFEVDEHLFANGTIDGVRVEDLCRFAVRKNINQVIMGPTTVRGDVIIKGPLNVNHALNGINIETFNRSVLKVDEPSALKGIKHFRQLVIEGSVLSKQMFAGFRIDKLYTNYMSLSRDQMVNSKVVFLNNLTLHRNLNIKGPLFTQNASINGIDLHRFDATVLKTFGDQLITGDFVFEDNVYFDKELDILNRRVNNLDLNRDLMLKGRNNVITVPKVFAENIVVNTNVDIKDRMTVQGVDISEMAKFTVMKTGAKYLIDGHKHFNSLEVDHLKVNRINGVEVSERSLLLTYGDQRVNGLKVMKNGLTANKEINSNTINNINIENLSQSLVLKGYNNSIHSFKTFQSPLSVNTVRAFGRVDGVDLNELNYFIGLPVNLNDLIVKLGVEDQKITAMQKTLDQQSIRLEFYELVEQIHWGPPLVSYYNPITGSQHLFVSGDYETNGCHGVDLFYQMSGGLKLMNKLFAIEAILMTSFRWNNDYFVVIANSKKATDSQKCLLMNPSPNVHNIGKGPAVTQVFVFDKVLNSYKQMAVIHSESVTDLKVIEDQNKGPCLVLAIPVADGDLGHPIVLCMNPSGVFNLRETTALSGKDQLSIVRSSSFNRTLMASINSWQSSNWMSNIAISDWSSQLGHFDHSIQAIPFLNPSAVHFVESPVHSSLFLFASEKKTSLTHNPLVRVFRYNPRRALPLMEVQQIKESEVRQIESVLLDDYKVLVLMLTNDRLDLYRLKGSSGFIRIDTIDVQNAQNFIVANSYRDNRVEGHLISISFKLCYAQNTHICKEETHVLRSKFNVN